MEVSYYTAFGNVLCVICKTEKTLIILGQVPAQSAHCDLCKTHGNSNPLNKFHHDYLADVIQFRLQLILKSKLINI